MNPLIRDRAELKDSLQRAKKTGDSKMVAWCEKWLKYHRRLDR